MLLSGIKSVALNIVKCRCDGKEKKFKSEILNKQLQLHIQFIYVVYSLSFHR